MLVMVAHTVMADFMDLLYTAPHIITDHHTDIMVTALHIIIIQMLTLIEITISTLTEVIMEVFHQAIAQTREGYVLPILGNLRNNLPEDLQPGNNHLQDLQQGNNHLQDLRQDNNRPQDLRQDNNHQQDLRQDNNRQQDLRQGNNHQQDRTMFTLTNQVTFTGITTITGNETMVVQIGSQQVPHVLIIT
jgi:hypothetical protein